MNFTPLEVGRKFNFTDVVENLCAGIREKKKQSQCVTEGVQDRAMPAPLRIYKTRDKWIKLTAQLPQAVFTCMQGNKE